ncbi:Ppx/GppA phosphatase family protein [Rhodovibrionaceae bacterium A322]
MEKAASSSLNLSIGSRRKSNKDAPLSPTRQRKKSKLKRVAVVDIGSNSVRLVVFDELKRVPLPLFNEKVLCGLGRGVEESGELNEGGVVLALETLRRFAGLTAAMEVSRLDLYATAAARDARNGSAFIAEVKKIFGKSVKVLTGREEARFAALGVLSANPRADGIAGDLGGGSLELVELVRGEIGEGATFPLGPLRMQAAWAQGPDEARRVINEHLDRLAWLEDLEGQTFFPVGGAWRSLAKLKMDDSNYALHMVQGFSIDGPDALELVRRASQMSVEELQSYGSLFHRRLETLGYAALLMEQLLLRIKPSKLVFTSFGLREGALFDRLSEEAQKEDPLAAAVADWAAHDGRFGDLGLAIADWCAPLFPNETKTEQQLRLAVCRLSDVGWRYHSDYRAEQMLLRVLRAQELCVVHEQRAFIALTLFVRYGGSVRSGKATTACRLLTQAEIKRAEVLGKALRVVYVLSGGAVDMLDHTALRFARDEVTLALPQDVQVPNGRVLEKRLASLANALGAETSKVLT